MKLPKDQPFWTSIILHLVVLIALFLATIIETLRPKEKPHVFEMVNAASAEQSVEPPAEIPPTPDIPMPDLPPVPEIAPVPKPVEAPPKPTPPKPAPAKPKPKIMTQEEFIRQFGAPKPRQQTSTQAPRPPVPAPRIEVPKLVVPSNPSQSAERPLTQQQRSALGTYSAQLRSRIDAAWAKPASLAGVKIAATVVFDVSATGRITNARLKSSSGNSAFDQSVLAAFRKVVSAGPTPSGRDHSFTMTFRMTD